MKSAASLYQDLEPRSEYYDRHSKLSREDYAERLKTSTTLYVGNLSFFTLESQLVEVFSQCGQVVNLIMGLNKQKMQPCGFCFVEYAEREQAHFAVELLNKSVIDGRPIRVDWDYGYEPSRQFGRGKMGGQVRDEMRNNQGAARDDDRPVHQQRRDYSKGRPYDNRGHQSLGKRRNQREDSDEGENRRHMSEDLEGGHKRRKTYHATNERVM